jgi:hypothetical protein
MCAISVSSALSVCVGHGVHWELYMCAYELTCTVLRWIVLHLEHVCAGVIHLPQLSKHFNAIRWSLGCVIEGTRLTRDKRQEARDKRQKTRGTAPHKPHGHNAKRVRADRNQWSM